MKAIVCEMCNGNNLLKENGVFVCQSCGTMYSVEEAKKLMVEISGNVDVSGSTVKIDNTSNIENYLTMAENALSSNNQAEAEQYSNKVIEIDPQNYRAWLIKGKAAGWQSTTANQRTDESINCFINAVKFAPVDRAKEIREKAAVELSKIAYAIIALCCNQYKDYPSKSRVETIVSSIQSVVIPTWMVSDKFGVPFDQYMKNIADYISNTATVVWNNEINKYQQEQYPNEYQRSQLQECAMGVTQLFQNAIIMSKNDAASNIVRYKNCIAIQTIIAKNKSYTYSRGMYIPDKEMSRTGKQAVVQMIQSWHMKIKELDPSYKIPRVKL